MTITLTQPAVGYAGVGLKVYGSTTVHTPGGWCGIAVADFIGGLYGAAGSAYLLSDGYTFVVQLGINKSGALEPSSQNGAALGHGMQMNVTIYDSTDTYVENNPIPGWSHDPVSCLSALLDRIAHDSILDQILAAVKTTFPAT